MAAVLARPLELDLLCQKLDAEYGGRIIGTGNSQEARRSNFLSKAIAAFVLHEAAGASLDDSIASSIDGGFDHGIDSVYIARARANAEADPGGQAANALPAKEILKHGVWLVLHVIFFRLQLQSGPELMLSEADAMALSREIDQVAQHLVAVMQAEQWDKQARSVFENKADCRAVKGRLMAALAQHAQGAYH